MQAHAAKASVLNWGAMVSPLRELFVAASVDGLRALDFGIEEAEFLSRFDSRARLDRNAQGVSHIIAQIGEYFAGARSRFNLPLDLAGLTPFQQRVLEITCRILPGQLWTYGRLAREIERAASSRAVGQALARNPIPIVIPCHRVIAANGSLRGYSGGLGLKTKRWLLDFEDATGMPEQR